VGEEKNTRSCHAFEEEEEGTTIFHFCRTKPTKFTRGRRKEQKKKRRRRRRGPEQKKSGLSRKAAGTKRL
jgi:hypothetical protein